MHQFKNILVQVAPGREGILKRAVQIAKADGARLTIVDAIPDLHLPLPFMTAGSERVIEQLTHDKQHGLEAVKQSVQDQGVDVSIRLLDGPTSVAIIREVQRAGHDLVIRAAKGKLSSRTGFFGTTATRLLRKCPCPVLLLKEGHDGKCRQIAAAVEADRKNETHDRLDRNIMNVAIKLQELDEAHLHVVHSWAVYGASVLKEHMRPEEYDELTQLTAAHAEKELDDLLLDYKMGVGQRRMHLLPGEPGYAIPQFCADQDIDLLVMGTVGRKGITGLLMGNTAEGILSRVDCSLLALKPENFVTPVR